MMKLLNRTLLTLGFLSLVTVGAKAQEGTYANKYSVQAIPYYEQLYKQRTWTRVDLAQKQNKGFFSKNREFTKLLIDAVKNDEITTIYSAAPGVPELDSLITKEMFLNNLFKTDPSQIVVQAQPLWEVDWPYISDETIEYNGKNYISLKDDNVGKNPETDTDFWAPWAGPKADAYFPTEITIIEVMEDVIFDKRRARQYNDIQSIKLIVSGDFSMDGANYPIATFAYKDLEEFFRKYPDQALWYNQYNSAENRNLADAFLLRLFHGELYKVDNPEDLTIMDIYGVNEKGEPSTKAGLIGAETLRMKMLEREHNLWSY